MVRIKRIVTGVLAVLIMVGALPLEAMAAIQIENNVSYSSSIVGGGPYIFDFSRYYQTVLNNGSWLPGATYKVVEGIHSSEGRDISFGLATDVSSTDSVLSEYRNEVFAGIAEIKILGVDSKGYIILGCSTAVKKPSVGKSLFLNTPVTYDPSSDAVSEIPSEGGDNLQIIYLQATTADIDYKDGNIVIQVNAGTEAINLSNRSQPIVITSDTKVVEWAVDKFLVDPYFPLQEFESNYDLQSLSIPAEGISFWGANKKEVSLKGLTSYIEATKIKKKVLELDDYRKLRDDVLSKAPMAEAETFLSSFMTTTATYIAETDLTIEPNVDSVLNLSGLSDELKASVTKFFEVLVDLKKSGVIPSNISSQVKSIKYIDADDNTQEVLLDFDVSDTKAATVTVINELGRGDALLSVLEDPSASKTKKAMASLSYLTLDTPIPEAMTAIRDFYEKEIMSEAISITAPSPQVNRNIGSLRELWDTALGSTLDFFKTVGTSILTNKDESHRMAKRIYMWLNAYEQNSDFVTFKNSSEYQTSELSNVSDEGWQEQVLAYSTAAMDLRSHSPSFDFIADVEFSSVERGDTTSIATFTNLANKIPELLNVSEGAEFNATKQQYYDSMAFRMNLFYNMAKSDPSIDSAGYAGLDSLMSMSNIPREAESDVSPYHSVYIGNIYNYQGYVALLNTINELYSLRMDFIKLYSDITPAKGDNIKDSQEELRKNSIDVFNSFGNFYKLNQAVQTLRSMEAPQEVKVSYFESWYLTPSEILQDLWHSKVIVKEGTVGHSLAELYEIMLTYQIDLALLDEYDNNHPDEPLRNIFSKDKNGIWSLCGPLNRGIAQSAVFVPLKTNVYDPYTYLDIDNDEFFDFHDRWGYYRKALYIDTNSRAATDLFTTGRRGSQKVVTLKDFLESSGEVVLYSDPNFYNAKKLAEMRNMAWGKVDNGVEAESQNSGNSIMLLWEKIVDVFTVDVYEILKTAGKETYSSHLTGVKDYKKSKEYTEKKVTDETKTLEEFNNDDSKEGAVMPAVLIDHYVGNDAFDTTALDSYNVMVPFAVVSSIYRSPSLKRELYDANPNREAVFIASEDLAKQIYTSADSGASIASKYANAIINWALLKNLGSQKTLSYETTLDMNNPLYLDIYGNILTESGLVVIPAAANATWQKQYVAFNTAFLHSYGKAYEIPKDIPLRLNHDLTNPDSGGELIKVIPSPLFTVDIETKTWTLNELTNSEIVDMSSVSIADKGALEQLKNTWVSYMIANGKDDVWDYRLYIKEGLLEVMRGAPVEFINKDDEGINTYMRLSVSGIKNAVKLDNFLQTVKGKVGNHLMSLPNPAFVEGLEYIILFVYKTVIIGVLLIIILQIFSMALRNVSIKDMGINISLSFLLLLIMMYVVPKTFELTYYQVNRFLLQDEMMELLLYTTEKEAQGVEVGMIDVKAPAKTSTLLVKIKDIDIPWSRLMIDILQEPIQSNLTNIYRGYIESDVAAGFEDFQIKGESIYMDLRTLINSSRIDINVEANYLNHYASEIVPASHFTPYYYFMDSIVWGLNDFNNGQNPLNKDYASYTTSVYKGGRIVSRGFPEAYYSSQQFLEFTENTGDLRDLLGLRALYEMADVVYYQLGDDIDEDINYFTSYQWYNEVLSEQEVERRITKLENHYVNFIKKNRHLIGAVSDETFIKIVALELSLQYNQLFSINSFNTIELYELAMEDLIRIGTAKPAIVMEGSPYDFVRYIYSVSDSAGIVVACALMISMMILNFVKPLLVFAVYLLIYASLFWNKLVLQKENHSMQGYLMLTGFLCAANIASSLSMKLTFFLPWLNMSPIVCMLLLFANNIAFLVIYFGLVGAAISNWRDMGAQVFTPIYQNMVNTFTKRGDSVNTLMSEVNTRVAQMGQSEKKDDSGWGMLHQMKERDANRERSSNSEPWK